MRGIGKGFWSSLLGRVPGQVPFCGYSLGFVEAFW